MSQRLALSIDLERCTGCKSCEAACKAEHGLSAGERRNRVLWLTPSESGDASRLDFLPLMCQHCERPACLRACPVAPAAIARDPKTGIVSIDESRCVGCGECVKACPYGAMGFDAIGQHAVKCDLCIDRRAAGEPTTACASVCPTRAITFGERDTLIANAADSERAVLDQDAFALSPGTVYLTRPGKDVLDIADIAMPAVADSPRIGEHPPPGYPFREERAERQADRVVPGGCNICFNACTTEFHLRDNKLVKITGNAADPILKGRVCPKSQLSLQLYNSEHRLTQPLKRVGKRGENKFVPVSWDEALDDIAGRLRKLADEHGPEALGIFSGTRTGTLANRGYIRLFSQCFGTPNMESTEPFCSSGKNIAYTLVQGGRGPGNSYTEGDLGSAELYIYIGDNQAETRPVHFGMINEWRMERGARMVVVDPRLTVTASKADQHLPIRPGGDLALALAMAQHILVNNLHDEAFCNENVLGWEQWRDNLFARGYTPEWAAPITDLAADDIKELAEAVATADGCVIFTSRGINQHVNSVQTNRALMFLAAITGNWGRRGGAFFNMSATVAVVADAPEHARTKPRRPKVGTSPVGWSDAMLDGIPYKMRALICCNNPLALWPDQNRSRKALEALDLLIHIDVFPNETSAYADYVLPAATGIEKGEVGRACEDRRVVWIDRIVDPPGEAKPDGWIWIEIGKRLGYSEVLREEWKDSARFWDEALIDNDQMRGCTQKRLHSNAYRWVRFPVATEDAPEQDTLYLEGTTAVGAPDGHRFPTASGKLEFWTEGQAESFAVYGLDALPEFYSERESLLDMPYLENIIADVRPVGPLSHTPTYTRTARILQPGPESPGRALRANGFDLELITGRPPAPHFHSWTHYSWQAQEMWPDLFAQLHPSTATRLGISDGERVTVSTSHGSIEARAWVYPGIRERAVFVPIGWGERQPMDPWQPVNLLTDAEQRCPVSEQTNLKALLCKVERKE